jgi:hypothetical protein
MSGLAIRRLFMGATGVPAIRTPGADRVTRAVFGIFLQLWVVKSLKMSIILINLSEMIVLLGKCKVLFFSVFF